MTGDGFGGRGWYVPHNYQVGAYSAYTVCDSTNQLYGWGGNDYGELGDDSQIPSDIAVAIPGMNNVKFYSTGYVSGVIKNDSTAWVWGGGTYSGLSYNPTYKLSNVKFLDAGISHVCFVKYDGTVWGAGYNTNGELGIGVNLVHSYSAVQMLGISNAVRAISVGYNYGTNAATIILLADGTVKIAGGNYWFAPTNSNIPDLIPGLNNIVDIKGNNMAAFALTAAGDVYSFGREKTGYQFGSLGLGISDTSLYVYHPPTKLTFPSGAAPIVALSANNDGIFALAIDENGNVYGWGDNRIGQLGDGTTINKTTPTLIATGAIDIFAGEIFSYILKADNTLWASGASSSFWTHNTGSIWMDLPNIERHTLTQINPTIAPMNLCAPKHFGVVPIQLLNFTCTAVGNTANLNWISAEEINADKYIVEYSKDGSNFQSIAIINAKGSNSNYKYVHQQVNSTAFYRLKMMDKDGSFKYSEIRVVKFDNKNGFTIAPNPANEMVYVFTKNNAAIKSIQLISMDGQVLKTVDQYNSGGEISIHNFPIGTYILKAIYKNDEAEYGRVIKM